MHSSELHMFNFRVQLKRYLQDRSLPMHCCHGPWGRINKGSTYAQLNRELTNVLTSQNGLSLEP